MIGRLICALLLLLFMMAIFFYEYGFALLATLLWRPNAIVLCYEDNPIVEYFSPVWDCLKYGPGSL